MLCKYKYRWCGTHGWYQADTEDAKKLFEKIKDDCTWFCIERADGVWFYWNCNYPTWSKFNSKPKYVR